MASEVNMSEDLTYQISLHHMVYQRQFGFGPCSSRHGPVLSSQLSFENRSCASRKFVDRLMLSQRLKEEGHQGCVNCINFSWDGHSLVSGSDDLKLIIWDWQRGISQTTLDTDHVANIFQAKFLPGTNDLQLVSAARDGLIIHHILAPSGAIAYKKVVAKHSDSAHKLALEPESSHVFLSCGEDGSVFQVDLREQTPKKHMLVCRGDKGRKIPLYSIFIDPSNYNHFAVSGMDQFARIFDRRTVKGKSEKTDFVKRFCPDHLKSPADDVQKANITCLVYSHDGSELLCSYNDEDIYLFDASHSSESNYIHQYKGHRNNQTVKGVNFFGPQSEYVVSGSDCGHMFLWEKESEEIVQCQDGDFCGVVNCLEPHPFMPVLAISGLDSDPKIFTPKSSKNTMKENLQEIVEANRNEREEMRAQRGDTDQWDYLLYQMLFRRYRRNLRRMADSGGDVEEETSEEEEMYLPLPPRRHRRRHRASHDGDGENDDDGDDDTSDDDEADDDDSSDDDDDDDDDDRDRSSRRGNVQIACRQS